jgi:class 3 adenylate cyclase
MNNPGYTALAMQTAMQDYTEDVRRTHGIPLQIRVGLNSGEALRGEVWTRRFSTTARPARRP